MYRKNAKPPEKRSGWPFEGVPAAKPDPIAEDLESVLKDAQRREMQAQAAVNLVVMAVIAVAIVCCLLVLVGP